MKWNKIKRGIWHGCKKRGDQVFCSSTRLRQTPILFLGRPERRRRRRRRRRRCLLLLQPIFLYFSNEKIHFLTILAIREKGTTHLEQFRRSQKGCTVFFVRKVSPTEAGKKINNNNQTLGKKITAFSTTPVQLLRLVMTELEWNISRSVFLRNLPGRPHLQREREEERKERGERERVREKEESTCIKASKRRQSDPDGQWQLLSMAVGGNGRSPRSRSGRLKNFKGLKIQTWNDPNFRLRGSLRDIKVSWIFIPM